MPFIPKRLTQTEKIQQFMKAEMLLFKLICGYYDYFTQAFKKNWQKTKNLH